MQIVINIPKDVYTRLFDNGIQDNEIAVDDVCEMARALRLGTPLSKGHGRLIDADELYLDIQTDEEMRLGNENLLWIRERIFDYAPTIVEADRSEEE